MDIYELLNKIIVNKRHGLSAKLFTQSDRDSLDDGDIPLFDLLTNISSLGTEIHNSGIKFHPMFVMAGGQRTFAVEDITDNDYEMLKNIDFERVPLVLRALVADILWTQKKEFAASQIAAEAYWKLFELWYTDEDNIGTLDMIRRAVCISVQTNQTSLYLRICAWLDDFLNNKVVDIEGFFSLRVMELFAQQKSYDITPFLSVLDSFILSNNENVLKIEQAYELKTQCLYKLKSFLYNSSIGNSEKEG
jgi:hypothetical protein